MGAKENSEVDHLAKVPSKTIKLAGRYKELFKLTNTGVAEADKDIGAELLKATGIKLDGEHLTTKGAAAYQEAFREITAAGRLAVGEEAIPFLQDNHAIDQVSIEFDIGHDHFGEVFHRKFDSVDAKGNTTTSYGHSVSYYEAAATETRAPLKAISAHLKSLAAKTLAKVESE